MKKIYNKILIPVLAAGLLATNPASAQTKTNTQKKETNKVSQNTSKTDKTAEKSPIKAFDVQGIRVILKPATNDVISAKLFISGGVENYKLDHQGIENLALNVLIDGGSSKYPKEEFHKQTEKKGIYISAGSTYDFSTLNLRTISKNWNDAWDIFQSVITQPAWDQQSYEQIKNQLVSGLMQEQADPDAFIQEMSMTKTFKDKRYEKNPEGTPESIGTLAINDLKEHYNKILKKKKMVLVVVGNVSEQDLKNKVQTAFASIPEGTADKFVSNPVTFNASSVDFEEREIATNYIRGIFPAPQSATREATAMRVAMSMLSDRLFVEVRTKRNLSYAPNASFTNLADPFNSVYVSTTDPNQAVKVMMDEIRKVKKEGFSEKELQNKKEGFLTSYYMAQETNDAQASALGAAELKRGWKYAETFKDEVSGLSVKEVNDAFRKYATNIKWFYLGDKSKADEKIFKEKLD